MLGAGDVRVRIRVRIRFTVRVRVSFRVRVREILQGRGSVVHSPILWLIHPIAI